MADRLARTRRAYDALLGGAEPPDWLPAVVRDSWRRSMRLGVDPLGAAGGVAPPAEFAAYRERHPLARVLPVIRTLLGDAIAGSGAVVAVTDADGRLLWVEGDADARRRAETINFAAGALWSEAAAGTNAPGVALSVDRPVQILGAEHFSAPVQRWNCVAVPVHDPRSGVLLGVIDVTGGDVVAEAFAMTAVRSVVAAVEAELRVLLPGVVSVAGGDEPVLSVLGDAPRFGERRVSRRHAEILLLLAENPAGIGADDLAGRLSESELDAVTVRAEVSRLRRDIGRDAVASRPYRLSGAVTTDLDDVRSCATAGDIAGALRAYGGGGLLTTSFAPGIVRIAENLAADLRAAAVTAGAPGLVAWTASALGADDADAWRRLAAVAPDAASRERAAARARLADARLK